MKKLLTLVSALALVFTSCSNDDDDTSSNTSSPVLVTKMVLTSPDEDVDSYWNNTINFTYNGAKLVQYVDEDGYKATFHYTNDLITKIEYYDGSTLEGQDLFTYNANGKLVEYRDLEILGDYEHKYSYTYNTDGTVTVTEYQGSIGNTSQIPSPDTYVFTNGELTSMDNGDLTYDGKNNPFKNVTGYQEIMTPEFSDDYMIAFGRNQNLVAAPVGVSTTEGTFASYTYNSNNYPITSVNSTNYPGSFSGTVTTQYFYNQ